jgi:hypothetical protein
VTVKIFLPYGSKEPVYAKYIEHYPPDPTAAIFWLKNRDPAHWRDAWQMEHVTGKYVIADRPLTEDEWIRQTGGTVIDVTPKAIDSQTRSSAVVKQRRAASLGDCGPMAFSAYLLAKPPDSPPP